MVDVMNTETCERCGRLQGVCTADWLHLGDVAPDGEQYTDWQITAQHYRDCARHTRHRIMDQRDEIDRLRAKVERLTADNERLTAERDDAQEAADAYRAEKADARATAERLTRERDELLRGMPDADDYAALDVRCGTFDPSVQVSGGPTVALSLYQKALRERDEWQRYAGQDRACLARVSGALVDAGMAVGSPRDYDERVRDLAADRDALRARLDAVEAACRSLATWTSDDAYECPEYTATFSLTDMAGGVRAAAAIILRAAQPQTDKPKEKT